MPAETAVQKQHIFGNMSTPKKRTETSLRHEDKWKSASNEPLNDSFQLGGPQKQNSHHTNSQEDHSVPAETAMQKQHIFENTSTPKRTETSLRHEDKWKSASNEPLNDSFQLGGPRKQNSHHTSSQEAHSVPAAPKAQEHHILEYVSTPKKTETRLEHEFKCKNASHSAPSDLQQLGNTLDQNSKHTVDFGGHEEPASSKARARPILKMQTYKKS